MTQKLPNIADEIETALDELEKIFIGRRALDKKFCALRQDLGRVQQRLIALADSLEGGRE
jgi:hypothetical protein